MQPSDDAPDLADYELAEKVAVGVVYLLEVVYVGHEDAHGTPFGGRRLQPVLELLVEAALDEEICQVVAVDQTVQSAVEVGPHRVPTRVLEHRVAYNDPVPVRERPLAAQDLLVDSSALAGAQIPDQVSVARLAIDPGVLGGDLNVPDHEVSPERVAAEHQIIPLEREEVPEARPSQDYEVRPLVREDGVFSLHD